MIEGGVEGEVWASYSPVHNCCSVCSAWLDADEELDRNCTSLFFCNFDKEREEGEEGEEGRGHGYYFVPVVSVPIRGVYQLALVPCLCDGEKGESGGGGVSLGTVTPGYA